MYTKCQTVIIYASEFVYVYNLYSFSGWMNEWRERETDRQTDRHTEREKERERDEIQDILTFYQTTNFGHFETERVCRRQF